MDDSFSISFLVMGDGLDTVESLQQRVDVIRFIKKNYTVEEGQLSDDQSMGITVCRVTP
jgi:hypothetical protein